MCSKVFFIPINQTYVPTNLFAVAGNEGAIKRMLERGEVASIPQGTNVTVLDKCIYSYRMLEPK